MSISYDGANTWFLTPPSIYKEVKDALSGEGPTYVDYTTIPQTPASSSGMVKLIVLGIGAILLYSVVKGN